MDDAGKQGNHSRITWSGLRKLDNFTDHFRRLVKLAAIELSDEADGLISEQEIAKAVQQVCLSHWFEQVEVRDERRDNAA